MDVSLRKVAGQMALVCLSIGALIAADKPKMDEGKVIAQAPPAPNQPPEFTKERLIESIRSSNAIGNVPPRETEQRVAAAGELYDAGIAKGLNPQLSGSIAIEVTQQDFSTLGPRMNAAKEVINNVDLSQATLSNPVQGLIYSEIIDARANGLAPDKIQEITTNLVSLGPRLEPIQQSEPSLARTLLTTASITLQQGGSMEDVQARGSQLINVNTQLMQQGYSGNEQSSGIIAAAQAITNNLTPDQALQVGVKMADISKSGVSMAASDAMTASVINTVRSGAPQEKLNEVVANTQVVAEQGLQEGSTVAAQNGANTTGAATNQGFNSPQAIGMGQTAVQMTAQVQSQAGPLAASFAGPTMTNGLINEQSPEQIQGAVQLVTNQTEQLQAQGNGLAAIQAGADMTGQTMLATGNEQIAMTAGAVNAQAFTNNLDEGGTLLAGQMAGETAGNVIVQEGGGVAGQEAPQEGAPPPPQEGEEQPQAVNTNGPQAPALEQGPPPVGVDQSAPPQGFQPPPEPPQPPQPPPESMPNP